MNNNEVKKRKLLKMTDNDGLITEGKKLYKIHHHGQGHTFHYEEIDPEEYDKRIQTLSAKICSYPEVNLSDIVRDALYDLPLKLLDKLETRLSDEASRPTPSVATRTTNRGTCVDLTIGRRFALNLRE